MVTPGFTLICNYIYIYMEYLYIFIYIYMFIQAKYMYTKTSIYYKLGCLFFRVQSSLSEVRSFQQLGPDPRCRPNTPGIVPLASSLYAHNLWDILPMMAKFQPDKGFGEMLQKWGLSLFWRVSYFKIAAMQHTAIQMTSRIFSQDT